MAVKNMNDIAVALKELKFNKKLVGGVDELDVWKKLDMLHDAYQSAFDVQEEVSRIRLEEKDAEIAKLKARITELEGMRGTCDD